MPAGLSRGALWAAAGAFVAALVLFYAVGSRGESAAPAPKPRLGGPAKLIKVAAPVTAAATLGDAADLPELAPAATPAVVAPEPKPKKKRKREHRHKHAARKSKPAPKPTPAPKQPAPKPTPTKPKASPKPAPEPTPPPPTDTTPLNFDDSG